MACGAKGINQSGKRSDFAWSKWESVWESTVVFAACGRHHPREPTSKHNCDSTCVGASGYQLANLNEAAYTGLRSDIGAIGETSRLANFGVYHRSCIVFPSSAQLTRNFSPRPNQHDQARSNTESATFDHASITSNSISDPKRKSRCGRRRPSLPSRNITSSAYPDSDVNSSPGTKQLYSTDIRWQSS